MGYKTKSMIYAKSLKASLNATSTDLKKANAQDEAIKKIGLPTDVKPNQPERNNIEKMTPKPTPESVTESLIKKAPETKAEPTKREKRKSAKEDIDSGVLSGLASGSEGIQTGTALGIMVKKIAGAVKGKKAKAKATTTAADAAKTSAANKAKGFSETPAPMPIKEDSGMNKSTPKESKPSFGDLSKMASGSQERIAEYKKRNWAMDATTGGTVKKSKVVKAKTTQKPTGNVATKHSFTKKPGSRIGKPGPSNVNKKTATIKSKTVKKDTSKDPKLKKPSNESSGFLRNQDFAKFFDVVGPFGDKGWFAPGGKK